MTGGQHATHCSQYENSGIPGGDKPGGDNVTDKEEVEDGSDVLP
jgi:hypothetical protein